MDFNLLPHITNNKITVYIPADTDRHESTSLLSAVFTLRWSGGLCSTARSAGCSRFSMGGGGTGATSGRRERGRSRASPCSRLQVLRKDLLNLLVHITWYGTRGHELITGNSALQPSFIVHIFQGKDWDCLAAILHLPCRNHHHPRLYLQQAGWSWQMWECFHRSSPHSSLPPDS